MIFFGAKGRIAVPIPFNAPNDQHTRILIDDGADLDAKSAVRMEFLVCDQYTIQGDLFSRAIREEEDQPIPLEDAIANMKVIDAVFRSAESGRWEEID